MQDKDLLDAIKLLRYGPSRRPNGNLRIMTYAAIAKALSISAFTVRTLLKNSELRVELEMSLHRTKTRNGLKRLREEYRRPTNLSE